MYNLFYLLLHERKKKVILLLISQELKQTHALGTVLVDVEAGKGPPLNTLLTSKYVCQFLLCQHPHVPGA